MEIETISQWSEEGCAHRTDKNSRKIYQLSNGDTVMQCIYCGFVYKYQVGEQI